MALDAGAKLVEFFGGYGEEPYDRQESVDLVMVARNRVLRGRLQACQCPLAAINCRD